MVQHCMTDVTGDVVPLHLDSKISSLNEYWVILRALSLDFRG